MRSKKATIFTVHRLLTFVIELKQKNVGESDTFFKT